MTASDRPEDETPGEGWRIYGAFAGSVAAATPFAVAFHSVFLLSPHMRRLGYGDLSWVLSSVLIAGPLLGVFLAGPPTVVYLLCRPPGHRLRTRRGWSTLCAGGATVPFGLLVGDSLVPLSWGGILLPAMVVGLLTAAAAGLSEPVES